jgi:hypothetical protein
MTEKNHCVVIFGCNAYPLWDCKGYSPLKPEIMACRWMGGYQRCNNLELIQEKKDELANGHTESAE